jgi:midasin
MDISENAEDEINDVDADRDDAAEADEFAYAKEQEKHDAQVLGSATKEQLEKSQNAMLDEDQTNKDSTLEDQEDKPTENDEPLPSNPAADMVQAQQKRDEVDEEVGQHHEDKADADNQHFSKIEKQRAEAAREDFGEKGINAFDEHAKSDGVAIAVDTDAPTIDESEIEETRRQLEDALNVRKQSAGFDPSVGTEMWHQFQAITSHLSQDLCEQLRLVLTESQASKLQGDFRTGKRLNMRKIIPYIASQFRKDKIWLRRTKPSKREYQIAIAIDDSKSMALYHSKQLALESLCVISGALTRLEAGSLAVLSYGQECRLLHQFEEPFSDLSGSSILQQFTFEQEKTHLANLMENATKLFLEAKSKASRSASDMLISQLMFVISDLDNIYQEGQSVVEKWIRAAVDTNVFLVFVIVDSPEKRHSILEQKTVSFVGNKVRDDYYIDHFADKNYIILRFVNPVTQVTID